MEKVYQFLKIIVILLLLTYFLGLVFDSQVLFIAFEEKESKMVGDILLKIFNLK
jgi:hypothetical protein